MSGCASSWDPAAPAFLAPRCSPRHTPRADIQRDGKGEVKLREFQKAMADAQTKIHGQLVNKKKDTFQKPTPTAKDAGLGRGRIFI